MRMVNHCNRLPQEVVYAPSLKLFKAWLDGALSNLAYLKVALPRAGGLELGHL